MKKKIVVSLLSAMLVSGMLFSGSAVTVNAAEAHDEIGGILDGMFGGNKPEYVPGSDSGPDYSDGTIIVDKESDINWGPSDSGNNNTQPTPPAPPARPNGSTTVPGGSTTTVPGGTTTVPGGTTTVPGGAITVPGGTITVPGGTTTVPGGNTTTVPGGSGSAAGTTTTPVAGCVAIPVTDENTLKIFPESMFVFTPEGRVSFNTLDATKKTYNVWVDGQLANQLAIVDSKNNLVALSAPQIVNDATGKTYLNVTIPAKTKGAKVLATAAQKSAFTRLYGIDGVMVNGVLIEAFQDTVRN